MVLGLDFRDGGLCCDLSATGEEKMIGSWRLACGDFWVDSIKMGRRIVTWRYQMKKDQSFFSVTLFPSLCLPFSFKKRSTSC